MKSQDGYPTYNGYLSKIKFKASLAARDWQKKINLNTGIPPSPFVGPLENPINDVGFSFTRRPRLSEEASMESFLRQQWGQRKPIFGVLSLATNVLGRRGSSGQELWIFSLDLKRLNSI